MVLNSVSHFGKFLNQSKHESEGSWKLRLIGVMAVQRYFEDLICGCLLKVDPS